VIERSRVRFPAAPPPGNNSGQVVYTNMPLSPSSIIWCRRKSGDVMRYINLYLLTYLLVDKHKNYRCFPSTLDKSNFRASECMCFETYTVILLFDVTR